MPEQSTTSPQPVPTPPAAPVPVQQSAPPVSPTPVTLPTPSTPNSRKKALLLGFLAIISIIGIAAGAYTLGAQKTPKPVTAITPTPIKEAVEKDPTADWKVYTDGKNGFSIKYPEELGFNKDPNGQDAVAFAPGGKVWNEDNDLPKRGIFIWVIENPRNLSAREYWEKEIASKAQPDRPIKLYALNDYDAIEVTSTSLDSLRLFSILVKGNNKLYKINFDERPDTSNNSDTISLETFKSMLNTFKFTNSELASDTSDWKTYTNNTFNYSIKYPSNVRIEEAVDDLGTENGEKKLVFYLPNGKLEIGHNRLGRGYSPVKSYEILIDNKKQLKVYEDEKSGLVGSIISPSQDEILFTFTFTTAETDKLIDDILSSFKFTE